MLLFIEKVHLLREVLMLGKHNIPELQTDLEEIAKQGLDLCFVIGMNHDQALRMLNPEDRSLLRQNIADAVLKTYKQLAQKDGKWNRSIPGKLHEGFRLIRNHSDLREAEKKFQDRKKS